MDAVEFQTLADELADDSAVAARAFALAAQRFDERSAAAYDSSALHLARFYNVVEQMALRVAHSARRRAPARPRVRLAVGERVMAPYAHETHKSCA